MKTFTYTVKGKAGKSTSGIKRAEFNGVEDNSDFVEYMSEGNLKSAMVGEAYLSFVFEKNTLFAVTEYTTSRQLAPSEVEELCDYTQGQWSDGIGEGFEQYSCMTVGTKEAYVSPWFSGQELTVNWKTN